jgi:hypothetical protein
MSLYPLCPFRLRRGVANSQASPLVPFVRLLHRGLAILHHRLSGDSGQLARAAVADLHHAAQARLFVDAPQEDAVESMHGGGSWRGVSSQRDAWGGRQVPSVGRSVVTASHIASAADRAPVRPSSGGPPRPVGLQSLLLHGGVAVGAATTNLGRDVHDPLGLAGIRGLAPSSPMSRPRTFPLGRLGRQGQLPHAPSLKTPGAPGRDASGPQQACSTPAHREAVASSRKHCPLSVEDGTNRGTAQPQVVP